MALAQTEVAQEDRYTPGGTIEVGDVFIITLTGQDGSTADITAVATGTTVAQVCADLLTAWNASTSALKDGITASNQTTYFKLLADTAGVPFYGAATTTESGGGAADAQTFTKTATTPNSGFNDWNTASNWSTNTVPVDGDSPIIDGRGSGYAILYGHQQTGVDLVKLTLRGAYPQVGTLTSALTFGTVDILDIGLPAEDGSTASPATIVNISVGTDPTVGIIRSTRNTGSGGKPPVQIACDDAAAVFTVEGKSIVGFGTATPGQSTTIGTITTQGQANVTVGSGVTLANVKPEGGTTYLNNTVTTIDYGTGNVVVYGSGNCTTATIGGRLDWYSTGTITTLKGEGKGFCKMWAGAVTTPSISGVDAKFDCDTGTPLAVTVTNGVDCLNGAKSTQINYGDNVNVAQAAI